MDIYYEIIGEGFPLVLLHGNNEDHHVFVFAPIETICFNL